MVPNSEKNGLCQTKWYFIVKYYIIETILLLVTVASMDLATILLVATGNWRKFFCKKTYTELATQYKLA